MKLLGATETIPVELKVVHALCYLNCANARKTSDLRRIWYPRGIVEITEKKTTLSTPTPRLLKNPKSHVIKP